MFSQEAHDQWVVFAEALPWVRGRGLAFGVAIANVQASIGERREREPDAPIGFIAADEPAVLAALAGGADEAAVIAPLDAAALAAFVDWLELRARLRADRRRLDESFAHSERLAALGTLVAGVGHEINNPLSAVILSVEVARRHMLPMLDAAREIARAVDAGEPPPPDAVQELRARAWPERDGRSLGGIFDEMAAAGEAIASIVRDLRTFARSDRDETPERVEVPDLIDHAIRLSGREATRRGVLERDYPPDLPPLLVPRGRVTQVIMNVFINALHAIAEVDRPVHRVRISARADEDFVCIAVSDTGPGIPAESLQRIFDPFFTTKRQTLGTGLGLSISREILRRLGGELSVESVYGEGATFLCFLPRATSEALAGARVRPAEPGSVRPAPADSASVLVIDDDERVIRSYARLLAHRYRIMAAYDGREAIEMLQSGSDPDVLLVELELPDPDGGRAILAWLAKERPELVCRTVLATSGGTEQEEFLRTYSGAVVQKPIRATELLAALEVIAALRDR